MDYELSVIVPTYNKASHLRRNLQSWSIQTLEHDRFEVIVVDDGSTDHTKRVVDEARATYDYRLRYVYLNRSGDCSPALTWNVGIRRAAAPLIVQAGADILAAKAVLALFLSYQHDSDGDQYTFGNCYQVHSLMATALLDHLPWQQEIHVLEQVFIQPYHHSSYWRVPMLACLPRARFEEIRGYDESYTSRPFPEDSDLWVRLEAMGVQGVNAPDIWGAHQFCVQTDILCEDGCDCPLSLKSQTHLGPGMKYSGSPEDIVRNLVSWGECEASYES